MYDQLEASRDQNQVRPLDLGIVDPEWEFGSNADRASALATGALDTEPETALASAAPETAVEAAPAVTPEVTPEVAPAADPFATQMDNELAPLLTTLEGAENAQQRQTASVAVANWSRSNIIDQDALQAYLARTDLTWEEKTATVGQLAVEVARSEFLAGWSYEGGVNNGGSNGFENAGSNRGEFPSYYQDTVLTYGRDTGAEWCTSFAGHTYDRLGFNYNDDVSQSNAKSIFWSGYRLNHWAETGQSNSGQQLTPADQTVSDGQDGAAYVNNTTWGGLTTSLRGATTPEARQLATSTFLENNGTPQPGDIMVLGNANNYRGNSKSHTVMVESYDAENQVIYTIEGNAGNAVSTRRIDLRNATDAASIVSSVRISASMLMSDETRATYEAGGPAATDAGPVSADQLLGRARGVNSRMVNTAHDEGYIESDDPNASAYIWQHGNANATDGEISVR